MRSVMSHNFSMVPRADIERSSFERSRGYKTTFNSGYLVPFFCDEVLPGDTYKVNANLLARLMSPLKVPVMDNIMLDTFFFFVPNRLVWSNWVKFMGEVEPGSTTEYAIPILKAPHDGGFAVGSLYDYFGLPTGVPDIEVNALPIRGYSLIYNTWFRDQNLIDSVVVDTGDADSDPDDYELLRRCKRMDYFTSCLPWPQKGDAVSLPLGDYAPVVGDGTDIYVHAEGTTTDRRLVLGTTAEKAITYSGTTSAGGDVHFGVNGTFQNTGLQADLTSATAATINSLREAFQLQKLLERDARGGTRYAEVIMSHFGVTDPMHAVLQRPVYLGGGTQSVSLHIVPQTSMTSTTPQGTLASFGVAASMRNGFTQSFTEHGYIIGLLNVRCDLTYQQGLNRMWSRSTKYDFYWPALAHLGEQAVLTKEIFASDPATDTGSTGTPDNERVFGYQERYGEYRYGISQITGELRSTYSTPLDVWHLSQKFATYPELGQDFIEENPPIDRISAVTSAPQFVLDSFIECRTVRAMPIFSVPGLIDHF